MSDYGQILELHELAVKEGQRYPNKRDLYHRLLSEKGKHFTGILGPRGVGKTIILKQIAATRPNALYLSMDSIDESDLFQLARDLGERYGCDLLLVDEIHYLADYEKQLKKIYDFLDIRVVFSSSVSLSLLESSYDLSRRIRLVKLFPFTFREYLFFKKEFTLEPLSLEAILDKRWTPSHLRCEHLFEGYLKGGLYPFSLEEPDVFPLLENIVKKIILKDIPAFADLRVDELLLLEKVLKFIGRSKVDGINYSSISRNIGITKYKAESYIDLLKKTFLLNVVFPSGSNVLREPKVLMHLPFRLLYKPYEEVLGELREDFAVEMLHMRGCDFHYLKSTRGAKTPDFLVKRDSGDIIVEVGGKGKGREQFKGITVDKKLILGHSSVIEGIKRPLHLLGFH